MSRLHGTQILEIEYHSHLIKEITFMSPIFSKRRVSTAALAVISIIGFFGASIQTAVASAVSCPTPPPLILRVPSALPGYNWTCHEWVYGVCGVVVSFKAWAIPPYGTCS